MLDEGLQSIPLPAQQHHGQGAGGGGIIPQNLMAHQKSASWLKGSETFPTLAHPTGESPFGFVLMPAGTEALWMVGYWGLSPIPEAWDQYFMRGRGILRGARAMPLRAVREGWVALLVK